MPGFINPYHFVPIGSAPVRAAVSDYQGSLTGRIDCVMTLKSPLAMPDHNEGEKHIFSDRQNRSYEHYFYPFYRILEKPAIPGSEVRGMVRSVYEAMTNSCLGVFDNSELSGRNVTTKMEGALLYKDVEKDSWWLKMATLYVVNTFIPVNRQEGEQPDRYSIDYSRQELVAGRMRYRTGDKVRFEPSQKPYKTSRNYNTTMFFANKLGSGDKEGYLLIGERGLPNNRHNSHIFVPSGEIIEISEETVENLRTVLELYNTEELNKALHMRNPRGEVQHSGYKNYTIRSDGRMTPVFFSKLGDHYYLSPSMKSREVYYRRLHEIAGDYVPCGARSTGDEKPETEGEDRLCPACAIFGTVQDKKGIPGNKRNILQRSYGSHLRFSDAMWCADTEPKWLERDGSTQITLPELAGPKITSNEFYNHLTRKTESDRIWNVDYKTVNPNQQKTLEPSEIKLNGRKFYWHQPLFIKSPKQTENLRPRVDSITGRMETKRNITTEILSGGKFAFTVYFECLKEKEIRRLLWALSPREGNRELCHKIGFAKPLGLGSVRIDVTKVQTRAFDGQCYASEEHQDWIDERSKGEETPPELIEMLDLYRTGEYPVSYPIGDDGRGGVNSNGPHVWFKFNRSIGATAEKPMVNNTLPVIQPGNREKGFDLLLPNVENGAFSSLTRISPVAVRPPKEEPLRFVAACRKPPASLPQTGIVSGIRGTTLTIQVQGRRYDFESMKRIPSSFRVLQEVEITAAGNDFEIEQKKKS